MPVIYTIRGQKVNPEKAELARRLRRNMTPAEKALWQALRANQLDGLHFRRQQVIAGYIADFYCHAAALIVEVDGPVHAGQKVADQERSEGLAGLGFEVIRFTNGQVLEELPRVLEEIRNVCKERMRTG
jgi:very-short-patch-repair endonuclease